MRSFQIPGTSMEKDLCWADIKLYIIKIIYYLNTEFIIKIIANNINLHINYFC